MGRKFYKRIVLVGLLLGLGICSYCVYLTVKNVNLCEEIAAHSIGVLDGLLLKQNAKCFAVHDTTEKMINDIFTKIRNEEANIKKEFDSISSDKKIKPDKRKQAVAKIERKWKDTSRDFEKQINDVRTLDKKLSDHINVTLQTVLTKISREMNLLLIINKGAENTLNVFYNTPRMDITNKVIKLLDKELDGFGIHSVS